VLILEGRQLLTIFQDPTFDLGTLVLLLFLNGVMYSAYNLASFLVLGQVELVAHAVLNAFRRVFIILFTSYYFGVHLSLLNIFGVLLAVLGVMLFGYSRAREIRPAS
jgi:uncharacterized membrane protein